MSTAPYKNQPVLDPITVTADVAPVLLVFPDALSPETRIALHVYEAAGVINLVSDASQTKGVTIEQTLATGSNFLAGEYLLKNLTLYAYAAGPLSITFIPVII